VEPGWRIKACHHCDNVCETLMLQVQQLLACGECQEQQRVQPTHCERLFFTVPATALVRAAKSFVQAPQGFEC
jgi:hypothetical protein